MAATYSGLLTPWKSGDVGSVLESWCSLSDDDDMLRALFLMQEWALRAVW
jgi:hypothetical protein